MNKVESALLDAIAHARAFGEHEVALRLALQLEAMRNLEAVRVA